MNKLAIVVLLFTAASADDAKKPPPKSGCQPPAQVDPFDPRPVCKADKQETKPTTSDGASAEVKAGTGVEKREVVGEAASFPAGTTVWVWSRITNGEPSVKHVWKRDGTEVWSATLKVGGKHWSTQSRRAIPKAGSWEVDVVDSNGTSLGSVAFKVE